MMWSRIQEHVRTGGIIAFAFGCGVWAQSALDKSPKLPWLHQQAAILHKEEATDIPALKAAAGCEHWRAETATTVAKDPDGNTGDIPGDICPHPGQHK